MGEYVKQARQLQRVRCLTDQAVVQRHDCS